MSFGRFQGTYWCVKCQYVEYRCVIFCLQFGDPDIGEPLRYVNGQESYHVTNRRHTVGPGDTSHTQVEFLFRMVFELLEIEFELLFVIFSLTIGLRQLSIFHCERQVPLRVSRSYSCTSHSAKSVQYVEIYAYIPNSFLKLYLSVDALTFP